MKMQIIIEGKVLIIEAEGDVSVKIIEENQPLSVLSEEMPDIVPAVPVSADDLFAKLSALRKELSTATNAPAYAIFKDTTLREMAEKRPQDLQSFSLIGGVGQAKLEKYGELFLAAINGGAA
jgi:ATP-dependent DNA helicase RecQ